MKKIVKKVVDLTPLRKLYEQIEHLSREKTHLEHQVEVLHVGSSEKCKEIERKLESVQIELDACRQEALGHHAEADRFHEHAKALSARNDEWAWEVRGLRLKIQRLQEYNTWFLQNYPKAPELHAERQASKNLAYRPLISIVLPTHNTSEQHLRDCLDSVLNQTYNNWQLCITDNASTLTFVSKIIEEYTKKDSRIAYKFRSKKENIYEATNTAAKLAHGEFIALLDHDALLWPNALYKAVEALNSNKDIDFLYGDEDRVDQEGVVHSDPLFKPDFSFYFLRSTNYISRSVFVRRSLFEKIGGFRSGFDVSGDWDLYLRLTQRTTNIHHVPTVLYSKRLTPNPDVLDGYLQSFTFRDQKRALSDDLAARKLKATLKVNRYRPDTWFTYPAIKDKPLVSIVIPTKDMREYLERCVSSILQKTTYNNYEIIIVENNSEKQSTFDYYETLKSEKRVKIFTRNVKPFNYSDVCNFGVEHASGKYLVMLNNDTEVLEPSWLEYMLGFAQLPDVGAVGAKLMFPSNNTYQHVGIVLGIGSDLPVAGHVLTEQDVENNDDFKEIYVQSIRECAGVTAACLMIDRKKFEKIKGFDSTLRVTFNDVDLNLKLLAEGYHNLFMPEVRLYHHESVSVGRANVNRNMKELDDATEEMLHRWGSVIKDDPFYNPNFSKRSSNYGLDIRGDNERIRQNIDRFLQ